MVTPLPLIRPIYNMGPKQELNRSLAGSASTDTPLSHTQHAPTRTNHKSWDGTIEGHKISTMETVTCRAIRHNSVPHAHSDPLTPYSIKRPSSDCSGATHQQHFNLMVEANKPIYVKFTISKKILVHAMRHCCTKREKTRMSPSTFRLRSISLNSYSSSLLPRFYI